MDHAWRQLANEDAVGEIRIFGNDYKILGASIGPKLGIAPALSQVFGMDEVIACPEGETVRQVDVKQKAPSSNRPKGIAMGHHVGCKTQAGVDIGRLQRGVLLEDVVP